MMRRFRSLIAAAIAVLMVCGAMIAPAAAQSTVVGHATFAVSDGGRLVGGSFVITDASGTIVRQGTIGEAERAIFFSTFVSGQTYTITVAADGYQAASQTLTATNEIRFNVTLDPLQQTKKTITIGVDKNGPTDWWLAEAPAGSTWTLTDLNSGKVYSGTFSGPIPLSIELSSAVGSGTFLVQINAGPIFLPYEETVTIRGNTGALYFELTPDTSVVPM
jgi:hypothetical protein